MTGLFRRITLLYVIVTLVFGGLLAVSAYAVLQGLFDLIAAGQTAAPSPIQTVYIAAAAILITLGMGAALEVTLRRGGFAMRGLAGFVYVLLALWSIGFGYGFWWKIIAARTETLAGIETAGTLVQHEIQQAQDAVQRLGGSLEGIRTIATAQQTREVSAGGSCGAPSPPGSGPFAARRSEVTQSVSNVIDGIERDWILPINIVLSGNGADAAAQGGLKRALNVLDPQAMRALGPAERATIYAKIKDASATALTEINSINQRQGASASTRLDDLAIKLRYRPGESEFTCYDPELARALSDAASGARETPSLNLPVFENDEGPAATAKAFAKIWDYAFWLAGAPFAAAGLAVPRLPLEPLSRNDIIALVASIAIDISIFVFGFIRTRLQRPGALLLTRLSARQRARLAAILNAFAADDRLDLKRVFNAALMRSGAQYYLIVPHLSEQLSDAWRVRAMFLQNILLVLKNVGAIDKSYEPSGLGTVIRARLSDPGQASLYDGAARQLRQAFGGDGGRSDADGPQADSVSLHRLSPADLLELQLLMRNEPEARRPGIENRTPPVLISRLPDAPATLQRPTLPPQADAKTG